MHSTTYFIQSCSSLGLIAVIYMLCVCLFKMKWNINIIRKDWECAVNEYLIAFMSEHKKNYLRNSLHCWLSISILVCAFRERFLGKNLISVKKMPKKREKRLNLSVCIIIVISILNFKSFSSFFMTYDDDGKSLNGLTYVDRW